MAAARDLEHGQMSSNSRGPSSSRHPGIGRNPRQEPPLDNPRDAEPQGGPSQLRVDVTVLRANNIPRLKNVFGLKFFVTVASQAIEKKTPSVPAKRRTARWGESLDAFILQPSTPLILRLHAERFARRNILVGTHEMIPVESKIDTPFVLTNGDGQAGESVTLYLTVIVSLDLPINAPIIRPTNINDSSVAQEPTRSTITTGPETISPLTDSLPTSEMNTLIPPAADRRGVSPAVSALHGADEAIATTDLSNKWEGALGRIKWVMDTVSPVAELHPYAKMAYGLLFAIPKTLLEQFQRDDNIGTLLVAMHDAFDFANQEDRFKGIKRDSRQARVLTLMLQHVCNCCDFIQSYAKDSQFWKRILKNTGSQVDKKIEDFRATLLEHRKAFLDEASITTEITALQILDDVGIVASQLDGMATQLKWVSSQVSDAELDAKIREIPYGTGSRFTPDKGCLTGTRTTFLDFIDNWVNDPTSERCLVLFGQAGTGKSSIAHEIARRFDKIHRLTSSFIFLRKEQSKREAHHLFTTLARDLSDRYPSFKAALGRVIKDNSSLRAGTRDYATLFESLILEPLKDLHIVGPILVVIDALDESGDVTNKKGLQQFLAEAISKLPSNFRVLITSRPEHPIESAFAGRVKIKYMDDPELAATTYNDILAFLRNELPPDVKTYCDDLTKRAEGSFQWAAVACGYILNPPDVFGLSKINCINHLLKLTPDRRGQDPLDELYKEVLEGYFTHENSRLLFRSVVGQLIASFEPLSIRSLITLRHASDHASDGGAVVILLRRLGSLLSNVNSSDENLPIIPLHTSFRDFLTNQEKSDDFCVDLRDVHLQLAHSCLDLLLKDLKFNICNLETSYLSNKDVADLSSRVKKHIPPALLYACRFWHDHIEHIGFESDLFGKLGSFFSKKLLFWLEAFSLTSDMRLTLAACSAVNMWLASGQADNQGVFQTELEKLRWFVNDASKFIRHFGMAMAKSAPHVYISALPFAPSLSPVSACYSSSFPRILRVEHGRLSHWPSLEMVIPNPGGWACSVSISPDGQRIISGSSDGTIRVWNATTGETDAGPFTGHTGSVNSVACSPDGQRIVSGSHDGTIRVWNASTGETVAGPFTGHTDWVRSVAFSPDGQRIVSASSDRTIRVWNATTGETEAGPFTGHTDWVRSVAFSPDGQRIVSGSDDETLRVWNTSTGEAEAGPFTGHTDSVWSVAFSPDGQRIVSGSRDGTIRVWNATMGEIEAGPFTGHTDSVWSVAFSPDGQRIVSDSPDETILMWSTTTGEPEVGPFTGHPFPVWSVAFSPDGQRIVSGSDGGTICVWNATTGEAEAGPLTGHTSSVWSVAFSPDGQRIVSGSLDETIRVWNATGETEAGPFTGHTSSVRSVAFSPDGQRIVSASEDGTIRVWNATTGETEAGPFTGHTDWVRSVACSPDGQRIVSASHDGTIRVWNATTGEAEAGPFTGHMDSVWSVAFSPDGLRIVSGSPDGTIRVWNTTTGATEAGPFTGHTEPVESVAISPDGQRIVSGSPDGIIRVWNATTGETEAGSFTGHTSSVRSVGFSPDGQRIASGSDDGTIRVWNATTGETEAGPFTGHTDWVRSVPFSPDGQRIVSASDDGTIRVRNATTGEIEAGPFTGHTSLVWSLAFSPDGQRIVSGSHDGTIRVWNTTTGSVETTSHVDFTNHSVINEEGWICGTEGELLMWIPQTHRTSLHRPSNIWVAGEYETRLDLSTFVHGQSWTTCINP